MEVVLEGGQAVGCGRHSCGLETIRVEIRLSIILLISVVKHDFPTHPAHQILYLLRKTFQVCVSPRHGYILHGIAKCFLLHPLVIYAVD